MDKKDNNKSLDELFKSSMGQGGANPFLNAASLLGAYWGNNNGNGSGNRDSMNNLASLQQLYGMGMIPQTGFGMDEAANSSQANNANNMNSNWYAMAQIAAQDYLTRLQMSAMMGQTNLDPSQAQLSNTFSDSLSSLVSSLSNDPKNQKKSNASNNRRKSNDSLNNFSKKSQQQQQKDLLAATAKFTGAASITPTRKNSNASMDQNFSQKRKSSTSSTNSSPSRQRKDSKDHSSVNNTNNFPPLMGVRLPPDTEIIKYTSNNQHYSSSSSNNKEESASKKMKFDSPATNNSSKNNDSAAEKSNGFDAEKASAAWMSDTLDLSSKRPQSRNNNEAGESANSPLNLSTKYPSNNHHEQSAELSRSRSPVSSNNLNSLQNLTAGIGNWKDSKQQQSNRDSRPRNLGRGIQTSRPKKNTVASLLAQSRASSTKSISPSDRYSNLDKNSISSDNQSNTDSESHNDTSGVSESEGENENITSELLKKPITQGWKRETIIRGLTKSGHLKGDVHYFAPTNDTVKLKNMAQIKTELVASKSNLSEENFSFAARKIVGTYLQAAPAPYATDGEFVRLTENDVTQRLEEIRLYTRQTSGQLNVEQRIEIARQQQMMREAKKNTKDETSTTTTKPRERQKNNTKDAEKNEKLEQLRKDKELKALQIAEAKRKRDEEVARLRLEEQRRRQEEKERRKQHLAIMKQLDSRAKFEERERKRHQLMLEKLVEREQILAVKKVETKILSELRKPREDSEIVNKIELPELNRIKGQKLTGQGFADLLMSFEFLHNFGETLGFDMTSIPSLQSLHDALALDDAMDAEDELLSVITHLLVCAIEDPGIPNPNRHLTLLGQTLRQADITNQNVSEILRIYLYSVATGEIRQQSGVYYEKEKPGKYGDLHMNDLEERQANGKNAHFFEVLHENERYQLSEALKDKPYVALNSSLKSKILAMLCNDLLLNKAVCKQIETGLESQASLRREKFVLDNKVRKYQSLVVKKQRIEQYEKAQQVLKKESENENEENGGSETKDSIDASIKEEKPAEKEFKSTANELGRMAEKIDDENNSDSDGTELEEDEDTNMTSDEVQKKLDKIQEQASQTKHQLQKALNSLRGKHFGQDRLWRRYWNLPTIGGIYVEALESSQSDLLEFQEKLESVLAETKVEDVEMKEEEKPAIPKIETKENDVKTEIHEVNGITAKNEDIDIEDSIPSSAIHVQKKDENGEPELVEVNHIVPPPTKSEEPENAIKEENHDSAEETKPEQMDVDEPKIVSNNDDEDDDDVCEVKNEIEPKVENDENEDDKSSIKWFSLIEKEIPLLVGDCPLFEEKFEKIRESMCNEESPLQGHHWEIHNNLQFYDVKSKLMQSNQESVEFKNESVLSTSGLKDESIRKFLDDGILHRSDANDSDDKINVVVAKQNLEVESQNQCDINHSFTLPTLNNLTIHNLSVILQCENLHANNYTLEELDALEDCKKKGIQKSFATAFVKKEHRFGWWKIDDKEELNQILKGLHAKGLRERNLRQNITAAFTENIDLSTTCPIEASSDDEDIDCSERKDMCEWIPKIAKRVEQQLLDNVEALEDKVANASMQIKGWVVPPREPEPETTTPEEKNLIFDVDEVRNRILNLENAIERRYLKPPLGNNNAEAQLMNAATNTDLNSSNASNGSSNGDYENIPKALQNWREAVKKSTTSSQLSMALYYLEQCIAWDKSIMKANCQFCQSGESEDKLLLCDSCDRGYHTYCFKPKMEKIPEGDWFCYECLNKATGEKKCIICGGNRPNPGKLISCELCPRFYHHDCLIPPLLKIPRGKWYCSNCISKAPPKKKPVRKQKDSKAHNSSQSIDSSQEDNPIACPSPSLSSFTVEEQVPTKKPNENSFPMPFSAVKTNNENCNDDENIEIKQIDTDNNAAKEIKNDNAKDKEEQKDKDKDNKEKDKAKADKKATKKLIKELSVCKSILEEMEVHEDSWPFLLPVNTKQFPTYKKIIKNPMDLSTIRKNLQEIIYKSRDEFVDDVRQIFNNCEVFNEDDSPVGKAGHEMRKYFELRWVELTDQNNS